MRQRAGFLSEASRQLAGTLDVRRTLLSALRIAVPALADWAALALFEAKATRLYSHGTDTLAAPVDADGRTAPLPAERSGLGEVRSTGRPVRLHLSAEASATGAALAGLIPDAELCEQATALGALEVLALPLSAGGRTFGALVLARSSEQLDARFSSEEMELAEDFVSRIAVTADAARLYEERAHIAAVLQSSLRPPALPEVPGVRLAARYRTAVEHIAIGGDFYDVHGSGDDWVLVIGDVCGKGVEAAVLTGRSRQTVRTVAHLDRSPARILSVLNEVLHDSDSDRFVTAVVARLRREPATGCARLDVATAGHPAPAVVRADGTVELVAASGVLSGVLAHAEYAETTVRLAPGDTMLLFTDGVYEARGSCGLYGLDRLYALLASLAGADPDAICQAVEDSVVAHLAGRAHDDMALLAVRCEAP